MIYFHNVWQLVLALIRPLNCRRPKTIIRWLCLRAFVYLGQTQSILLSASKLNSLTQAVELGVFLNRWFDGKQVFCPRRYRALREGLPEIPTRRYLYHLRRLEKNRPDHLDWSAVFHYRRAVLNVSLNYLFALCELKHRPLLLPLCSIVQLADDVLDVRQDRAKNLPTFLTSRGPRPERLARQFWRELRHLRGPQDAPIVLGGGCAYLLCRLIILCSRV